MFWSGGIGDVWIGGIFAILVALVGVWANSGRFHFSGPVHLLLALLYAPLCVVVFNYLPSEWFTNSRSMKIVLLVFVVFVAVEIHRVVLFVFASTRAQPLSPPSAAPAETSTTHNTIESYKTAINEAEGGAKELLYIQHRIAPYFKTDNAINFIASARFGKGSPNFESYTAEHHGRRQAFYRFLADGGVYREIFPRERLLRYVSTGTHADNQWPLPAEEIVMLLTGWKDTLLRYPNFRSAISDESIPIKYHIVDQNLVVLHEPVGKGDVFRLNSVFVHGERTNHSFREDFEIIWSMTPEEWRDANRLSRWITSELIPLAQRRGQS